ncbi:homoserine kinase [Aerococcus sp. JJEM-2022c]|uniref:homoserine kinase n=1 Tax=Aerococcus sp. Group 2 TaxID=2976811 RepID=UPI00227BC402|nr:homoserine kinase [Aerococcus sp. Group 2]MCY3039560.1 homoserine kinase [Aerococcus sp. Group 2]
MQRVIVPATSANLGPGFDSIGVAVDLYLRVDIIGPSQEWEIRHNLGEDVPTDENNLLIKTILDLAPKTPPQQLYMHSQIPITRGLGSSSSAIVAAIEIVDYLNQFQWSLSHKINLANKIEGHPDNIAPCLAGGLVIGVAIGSEEVIWSKEVFPNTRLIATVPHYQLSTKKAREVLPDQLSYADAVRANGMGNVLVSKLMEGNLDDAGRLMEQDYFHKPYRKSLVPELEQVRQLLKGVPGVYGTYLSGAGPTVMTMVQASHSQEIKDLLGASLEEVSLYDLAIDDKGSRFEEVKTLDEFE